jgi:hypothetical protein
MLEPISPGPIIRAFNTVGGRIWPTVPVALTPETLIERAQKLTGLHDIDEDAGLEGLEVLCRAIADEADLTVFGRFLMQIQVTNALVTRLLQVDARKTRPEVLAAPLRPPLLVVGLPRTGTTMLHRLLSLVDGMRALSTWEVRQPLPRSQPDLRRDLAWLEIQAFKWAAPGIDAKHRVDANDPEECQFLLDPSLASPSFWCLAPVFSYLDWLLEHDMTGPYARYGELLKHLQAQDPGRRMVLKAPCHTPFIDVLAGQVPDVMLVQTHRNPVRVTSSVNSLIASFHSAVCDTPDLGRMARSNVRMLEHMANHNIGARQRLPGDAILDVYFEDLVGDPIGTVRRIHEAYDLELTEDDVHRIEVYLSRRHRHRFGKHVHRTEDFEMTEDELVGTFAPYNERFEIA